MPIERRKIIIKVIDLHMLERRSVVKVSNLKRREIKSRHMSGRLNNYESICLSSLTYNFCLRLLTYYHSFYTKPLFTLNIWLIVF